MGTYIHGPLLPKNPALADVLIAESLRRRHGEVAVEPLDDALDDWLTGSALMRRR